MADPALTAWLRLTLVPGVGPETQRHLLAAFGLPEQVFSAPRSALKQVVGKKADLLLDTDNQEAVARALDWAGKPGNRILTLADPDYPQLLLESADPPSLLYVKGRVELLNRSALAIGIDGAAHRGGLKGEGGSVAVIGTGADRIYPSRHKELALQLATEGAIVSEFPLGTPAVAHNFPRRNRIIAGMAKGCLVVEAALESGSLITARLAAELGREVFALPGSIHSPVAKGCHRLIQQGAKLVQEARDIVEEIGPFDPPGCKPARTPLSTGNTPTTAPTLDPGQAAVLDALGHDPANLDQLLQRTGLTTEALCAILVTLELADRVASLPGGRYQRLSPT